MSTATQHRTRTRTRSARTRVSGCGNCQAREAHLAMQARRGLAMGRSRQGIEARFSSGRVTGISITGLPGQTPPTTARAEVNFRVDLPTFILPTEPDQCEPGTVIPGEKGALLTITLRLDGRDVDSVTECFSEGNHSVNFDIDLLDGGPHTIQAVVDAPNSGTRMGDARQTVEVVVEEQPPGGGLEPPGGACTSDADCPGNQVCRDGTCVDPGGGGPILPCFLDPFRSCGRTEALGWTGAAVLLLVVLVGS